MFGINDLGVQWHNDIFILQYTPLKMAVLLHKTALVNFLISTTVQVSFVNIVFEFLLGDIDQKPRRNLDKGSVKK